MKLPKYIITVKIPSTVKMFFQNLKNFSIMVGKASMVALGVALVSLIPIVAIAMFITGSLNPTSDVLFACRVLASVIWLVSFVIAFLKINELK